MELAASSRGLATLAKALWALCLAAPAYGLAVEQRRSSSALLDIESGFPFRQSADAASFLAAQAAFCFTEFVWSVEGSQADDGTGKAGASLLEAPLGCIRHIKSGPMSPRL